jgi:hypothetical protein
MRFEQETQIAAPVAAVWSFMTDIPSIARCLPGVEEVKPVDRDLYGGRLSVRVGQIAIRLDGTVAIIERDAERLRCVIEVKAAERRLNSRLSARTTFSLGRESDSGTAMRIETDASILGKLGEFGQAVLRRKADQLLEEFAGNLTRELAPGDVARAGMATPSPAGPGWWARLVGWLRAALGHRDPGVES